MAAIIYRLCTWSLHYRSRCSYANFANYREHNSKKQIWIRQVIRGMAGRLSGRHHLLLHFIILLLFRKFSRDAFWERNPPPPRLRRTIIMKTLSCRKIPRWHIYLSSCFPFLGFAVIWHIIWLAVLGLGGALVCFIIRAFDEETEYILPAKEVAKIEAGRNK